MGGQHIFKDKQFDLYLNNFFIAIFWKFKVRLVDVAVVTDVDVRDAVIWSRDLIAVWLFGDDHSVLKTCPGIKDSGERLELSAVSAIKDVNQKYIVTRLRGRPVRGLPA